MRYTTTAYCVDFDREHHCVDQAGVILYDGPNVVEAEEAKAMAPAGYRVEVKETREVKSALIIRSQHSRGSNAQGFGGPDTYVAVIWTDDLTVEFPLIMRRDVLAARGIKIKHFGEGYREHTGPRSALGKAIRAAQAFAVQLESDVR